MVITSRDVRSSVQSDPRRIHDWRGIGPTACSRNVGFGMSAFEGILLQKSKVASVRIFGETLKREAIDDSDNLSRDPSASLPRVADIAVEFLLNVSRTHRLPLKAGHVINLSRNAWARRKGRGNSRRRCIPAWWAIAGYSFTAILRMKARIGGSRSLVG
jgi:hypothetical protein